MLAALFRTFHRRRIEKLAGIPGPTPVFPFGTALDFVSKRRPWEVCADYADKYGPMTLVWLGGRPAVVLNSPELIGSVLVDDWKQYYKNAPVQALRPVITPHSLFITNPPEWEQARRENPLQQIDVQQWLEAVSSSVRGVLDSKLVRLQKLSNTGWCDLYWEMQRLAFHCFAVAFWGQSLEEKHFQWFQTMARTGSRRINWPLPLLPPLSPWFHYAKNKWYSTFTNLVRQARSGNQQGPDLLSTILKQGTSQSDFQLAEALATNFFGGVFSCSSTINSALYLASLHPQQRDRLTQALTKLPSDCDWKAVDAQTELNCFLREVMRYLPAVPLYFRNVNKENEVQLGGHTLPPDTQIFISNWWLHRYSPHWQDPREFRPERWAQSEGDDYRSGYFFPFGRGPRTCIGMPFAVFFMKLALYTILTDTDVTLDSSRGYKQSFFFGVMMPKGLYAKFTPRTAGK